MTDPVATPELRLRGAELRVAAWPAGLPVPFGLRRDGGELRGPARLRHEVLLAARCAGLACRDTAAEAMLRLERAAAPPAVPGPLPGAFVRAWELALHRGICAGLELAERTQFVVWAAARLGRRSLVVVVDSGVESAWQRALGPAPLAATGVDVRTVAQVGRAAHVFGDRYELFAVDAPEAMPGGLLDAWLDGSGALHRVGFVAAADARLLAWSARIGPLCASARARHAPACHELRIAMPVDVACAYATAWHTFLAAFDRFAAAHPQAGFGTFVERARREPAWRPAVLAWHAALRCAAWHEHKAQVVAQLLELHRGQRLLVFTPSREVAYELAERHLIPAVTAELPRAERDRLVAAFLAGRLPVLAAPRLLDRGLPEGCADAAILVGGGFGRDQRTARIARVAAGGVVHELVSLDTLEVGRANRWRETAAARVLFEHEPRR